MSGALYALLGYAAWGLLLAFSVVTWRSLDVLRGKNASNEFQSGVPHGPDPYWRLNRAHMNTVENLPIFGAVVVVGVLGGVEAAGFHTAALTVLGLRILQTLVHLSGGSALVVNVRFGFFVGQKIGLVWMIVLILASAGVL